MYASADAIRGNSANQEVFFNYKLSSTNVLPSSTPFKNALMTIIKTSLKNEEEFPVRAAAAYCFQVCLFDMYGLLLSEIQTYEFVVLSP